MTPTERQNDNEWRASPKPKKPLDERLDSLSDKIHKAQYAVRNKKGEVIGFVSFDIYNRIRKQEHDKARNQAIDDCLIILSRQSGTDWVNRNFLKHELESLKTKP